MTIEQLYTRIKNRFGSIAACQIEHDQITLELNPNDLLSCCKALRTEPDFQFEQLMDLCAVDYLTYGMSEWATNTATAQGFSRGVEPIFPKTENRFTNRFAVVYHLLSITLNHRIRLRVFVNNDQPIIPSVIEIWNCANWYEREAFDLFGIMFDGHPDLRRILTDYGFVGHPFRKDFPLIGEVEMRYDAAEQRVIYEPVSIQPRTLVPRVIRHVAEPELQEENK